MNSNPLVSILTPIFNGERYLEQCLQSVLCQTYARVEHVFADGGSTDRTLEILQSYKAKYPDRIQFVSGPDNGVGSALNKAYKLCRGKMIGWIDSDDIYEPNAIETAVHYFQKNENAYFIYGGCNMVNAQGEVIGCFVIKDFNKEEWLNIWHYIVFCAIFFKREVIEKVGFVNDLGNDLCFYLRVAQQFQLQRIPQTLTNWRLHEGSISLKKAPREHSIRVDRAKEDFFLVLKYKGSLFSPRALTYYAVLKLSIAEKLRPILGFCYPFLRKIAHQIKFSAAVAQYENTDFFRPFFKNIRSKLFKRVQSLFVKKMFYENRLYNSACNGYPYYRAGQRINRIAEGTVVNRVRLYMDKVGHPKGIGSCVVRKVSDDSVVGTLGTVNLADLPDASAIRPQWVCFDTLSIKIPQKGDYRIVFEWDPAEGDEANYPRVRYNNTNAMRGVFTYFSPGGQWKDAIRWDASIQLNLQGRS